LSRETLGKRVVIVFLPSRYFFYRASVLALGKVFAEYPIKTLDKETFADTVDAVCCLPSITLGKAFAVCPGHTAKPLFSGSVFAIVEQMDQSFGFNYKSFMIIMCSVIKVHANSSIFLYIF